MMLAAQTLTLQSEELNESSGVAVVGDQIWSHNDSGDSPRLFIFDRSGSPLGQVRVAGARAVDWEDMCAFTRDNRRFVAVGDVGDNAAGRSSVQIYVVEVPSELRAATTSIDPKTTTLPLTAVLQVTYPDGAANCEALAYDPLTQAFVLATKELTRCRLFSVPVGSLTGKQAVEAKQIGRLVLPLVTGGDISPDGRQLVLSTYGPACLLTRRSEPGREQEWLTEGDEAVKMVALPGRKQGESICFSPDARQLFLTSEFLPAPLFSVPLPALDAPLDRSLPAD
jgi:hypothetical protein